jgi:hypothetical protein
MALATIPEAAFAYVGPGAGISVFGALWGLILGVVTALGIVLFWPIRIMLRKRKAAAEAQQEMQATSETAADKQPAADDEAGPTPS